jgi:hypothetical protein
MLTDSSTHHSHESVAFGLSFAQAALLSLFHLLDTILG